MLRRTRWTADPDMITSGHGAVCCVVALLPLPAWNQLKLSGLGGWGDVYYFQQIYDALVAEIS